MRVRARAKSKSRKAIAVEYVDVESLEAWDRNPRTHADQAIRDSVVAFGFRDPIAANRATGEIEEGHGRVSCLLALKSEGAAPPPFVLVKGGSWLVPVIWFSDDRLTQERYALAHNRTQDMGGYDEAKLDALLADLGGQDALLGTGFEPVDSSGAEEIQARDVPVSDVMDRFWMNVTGPLPRQRQALQALADGLKRVPGVSVTLGTTEAG